MLYYTHILPLYLGLPVLLLQTVFTSLVGSTCLNRALRSLYSASVSGGTGSVSGGTDVSDKEGSGWPNDSCNKDLFNINTNHRATSEPVSSYKLRYFLGVGLVEIAMMWSERLTIKVRKNIIPIYSYNVLTFD